MKKNTNMFNHSKIDEDVPISAPVMSGDLLLHNGFRYVLHWNPDESNGIWGENAYEWYPYGKNWKDAPDIPFNSSRLIPGRWISEENVLWVMNDDN